MEARASAARAKPAHRRAVLMTVFDAWESSYSLTTVVTEQALALAAKGWYVEVWVGKKLTTPPDLPGVHIVPCMPAGPWKVGQPSKKQVADLVTTIRTNLAVVGAAKIITHDLMFVPHYLPVTLALHEIGDMPAMQFWHQIHSIPNPMEETQQTHHNLRHQLPGTAKGHRLLVMAREATSQVALWFNTDPDRVDILRNSRDFYRWNHFTPTAKALATSHGLLRSDLVLVYPYSQPRYMAKGVPALISLAACLQATTPAGCRSLRLVLPNAHVVSHQEEDNVSTSIR
jgi:hypothetical protein